MNAKIINTVEEDYPDYLRDESRLTGTAESISFPTTESDIRETIEEMSANDVAVTTQGARTGISGSAVPLGGHILNLSKMNRILGMKHAGVGTDTFSITVEPGILLSELRSAVASKDFNTAGWSEESLAARDAFKNAGPFFFPPDPTETSAALGGMVGANASGACTFHYGATRAHVERIRAVLADGDTIELKRGMQTAVGRSFSLVSGTGREISGNIPSYDMPAVKNAAGYYSASGMDLIDLFIGSEGTLGVFSEIELRLSPSPTEQWGVVSFFNSVDDALNFVTSIRDSKARPVAIEFFGPRTLDLLRAQRDKASFCDFPELPESYHTAVYVEYHGPDEDTVTEALMTLSEIMVDCGGDEDTTWIADSSHEMQRLKNFRHAVPESVNMLIDQRRKTEPALTKLGTDMSVPDSHLRDVMNLYSSRLKETGLEYVMFGHVGNNHVHVNILPRSMDDYETGKKLYLEWAKKVVSMGGTVSAEHGVGKLKKHFLEEMYGEVGIREMRELKRLFDPKCILNRGNLFE
jgi:D-lactate dehydrogenase (cytochrome)